MDHLFGELKKLTLDWGSLVALLTGGATIAFFLFNLISINDLQTSQIKAITDDVDVLKRTLPGIQRALGRIEGKLNIYNRDN